MLLGTSLVTLQLCKKQSDLHSQGLETGPWFFPCVQSWCALHLAFEYWCPWQKPVPRSVCLRYSGVGRQGKKSWTSSTCCSRTGMAAMQSCGELDVIWMQRGAAKHLTVQREQLAGSIGSDIGQTTSLALCSQPGIISVQRGKGN